MIAKRLEAILVREGGCAEAEMVQRFQKLRDAGQLPRSRGKNAEALSYHEIVIGLLSIVSEKPNYAGLRAKMLKDLRPVGGSENAFAGAKTFAAAIESILSDKASIESLLEIRISEDEFATNSHGRAAIYYREGKAERVTWYMRKEALSLLSEGGEKRFNPRDSIKKIYREVAILPQLLSSIFNSLKMDAYLKKVQLQD